MPISTCIFDAYGTLFDVAAAARIVAAEPGNEEFAQHWPQIAQDWRLKQLQYTWLRAVSGHHIDFWIVTQNGLDFALEASGVTNPSLRERLLALYWELAAYSEVPLMLQTLKSNGLNTAILSNGSPAMLEGAVKSAGINDVLDDTLSVESVGVFKPHSSVYELVNTRFETQSKDVLFVSSNGWDAAAAAAFGFTTVWVNRAGDPMDRLQAEPHHVLSDLSGIPDLVASLS
jgi:2-haloacid dehalogenase